MSVQNGEWHTSRWSGGPDGTCVEVRLGADDVQVRDSKDPAGPVLIYTHAEWRAFLAGVRNGEFDLRGTGVDTD